MPGRLLVLYPKQDGACAGRHKPQMRKRARAQPVDQDWPINSSKLMFLSLTFTKDMT